MHDVVHEYKNSQFIISSHSPILLGYPGAHILSFDGARAAETEYEQLANMQIVRRFLNDRQRFLQELFKETPRLFKDRTDKRGRV
jgi:predicted ATPase